MSEYQYYEFLALDRRLSPEDQSALRARSSRAEITAARFSNSYNYGDFKGDVDSWMELYFDAHLYLANWGSRLVRLKFPPGGVALEDVKPYCAEIALEVAEAKRQVHLTFEREDDEPDDVWDEGPGLLDAIAGIRSEIASGDFRPLYLGWLGGLHYLDEDDENATSVLEPRCPAGLGDLSAAQSALVDFLGVDEDLVAAAAEGSRAPDGDAFREEVGRWLETLPNGERTALLATLLDEAPGKARDAALARFRKETEAPGKGRERRSTAWLLDRARVLEADRRKREAAAAREARERRVRVDRELRERKLAAMAGKEPEFWRRVEQIIAAKRISAYGEAVDLLRDLVELGRKAGQDREIEAQQRLAAIRQTYASRTGLIRRLDEAGLVPAGGQSGRRGAR